MNPITPSSRGAVIKVDDVSSSVSEMVSEDLRIITDFYNRHNKTDRHPYNITANEMMACLCKAVSKLEGK